MTAYDEFISKKYRILSDMQIKRELSYQGKVAVSDVRSRLNNYPADMSYTQKKKLAKLLVLWFNGSTVADAAREVGIELTTASKMIRRHALTKQRSYNTITLVIESKMNFTEAELELIENEYLKPYGSQVNHVNNEAI